MSCCHWWLKESDSCLEQARLFGPVHPVPTNASYSGQLEVLLVASICYQDGCCEPVTVFNNAGASLASRLGLLKGLLAEHEPPAAREELKRL